MLLYFHGNILWCSLEASHWGALNEYHMIYFHRNIASINFKNFLFNAYAVLIMDNLTVETVLLSTHNICFGWEIRKIIFSYTLLSGGLC